MEKSKHLKTVGILGGIGPMATVRLMELIIQKTEAGCDRDHIPLLVSSIPQIPDRSAFLEGRSDESPCPALCRCARQLEAQGADIIAVPCMTAHYFLPQIQKSVKVPVMDAVAESCRRLEDRGFTKAAVLATRGTIQKELFQNAMAVYGIRALLPDEAEQERLMRIIYQEIKAGKAVSKAEFDALCGRMEERGAQAVILGCTELSLIPLHEGQKDKILDPLEIMAEFLVHFCGGTLKRQQVKTKKETVEKDVVASCK